MLCFTKKKNLLLSRRRVKLKGWAQMESLRQSNSDSIADAQLDYDAQLEQLYALLESDDVSAEKLILADVAFVAEQEQVQQQAQMVSASVSAENLAA